MQAASDAIQKGLNVNKNGRGQVETLRKEA